MKFIQVEKSHRMNVFCIILNTSCKRYLTLKIVYSIFIKKIGQSKKDVPAKMLLCELNKKRKRKGELWYGTAGYKKYDDRRITAD